MAMLRNKTRSNPYTDVASVGRLDFGRQSALQTFWLALKLEELTASYDELTKRLDELMAANASQPKT